MTDQPSEKPKIVVDSDWKAQAQAEKEKLAREVEAKQAQAQQAAAAGPAGPAAAGAAAGPGGQRELPPASFETLVASLATQILYALGGYEDPRTKRRYVDLDLAKHHIDTLTVLEAKTKGNLTEDEKKVLDNALYECRMQYVQIAQRVIRR